MSSSHSGWHSYHDNYYGVIRENINVLIINKEDIRLHIIVIVIMKIKVYI